MIRLAWRRLTAWLIDWLLILAWVAVTAAVGVPLYLAGVTRALGVVALNVVSAVVVVLPVVAGLAWAEAGRRHASVGKRARHLRVIDARTGAGVSLGRALVRNALKVGLPWTIGHIAVIALATGGSADPVAPAVWVVTALAYVLPLIYVVALFVGDGRTPYDRVAGTRVVADEWSGKGPAPGPPA